MPLVNDTVQLQLGASQTSLVGVDTSITPDFRVPTSYTRLEEGPMLVLVIKWTR